MHNSVHAEPALDDERRANATMFEQVECAVDLQRKGDEWGARDYLSSVGVAPHIILRVMSCPAFRRKKPRGPDTLFDYRGPD